MQNLLLEHVAALPLNDDHEQTSKKDTFRVKNQWVQAVVYPEQRAPVRKIWFESILYAWMRIYI